MATKTSTAPMPQEVQVKYAPDWKRRFTILETLHDSIFGRVYLCSMNDTKELRVIKFSYLALMKKGVSLRSALVAENPVQEVEMLRKFTHHPHIVHLYDVWCDDDFFIEIFEYCAGGEMFPFLSERDAPLSEEHARHFFVQLLKAVSTMHQNEIAHMDLSLENILLDEKMTVLKVCDFGLALNLRNVEQCKGPIRIGKPGYTAPELFHQTQKSFTPKELFQADVWSLGIILFLCLSLRPPFKFAGRLDRNFELFSKREVSVRDLFDFCSKKRRVSTSVHKLLNGLLQINPTKRFTVSQIWQHPWVVSKGETGHPSEQKKSD